MTPTRTANPAAPKPPKVAQPTSTPPASTGAAENKAAPPASAAKPAEITTALTLCDMGSDQGKPYAEFVFRIDPLITKRLLTRTGRATIEQMQAELPRYIERIVKRALENEVYILICLLGTQIFTSIVKTGLLS